MLDNLSEKVGRDFQVIIITAHNEQRYYAEAFKFGAIHFLMKPIDKQMLKEAIQRAQKGLPDKQVQILLKQLQEQVQAHMRSEKAIDKIAIEGMSYTEIVQLKDVVYLEASGRYTYICLNSIGSNLLCSTKNLGEFEKKLEGNPDFFRIHRNKILNLSYVQRFFKKDYSFVLFAPFEKQFASKDRFKEFLKYIDVADSQA